MIQKVFILLKPDCVKRGLADTFLSALFSLELAHGDPQEIHLKEKDAKIIYRDCVEAPFYQDLEYFITSDTAIGVLVSGDDAIAKVAKLKKEFRKEHKERWVELSEGELALWGQGDHPRQHELNLILRVKNLIHSTDTENEAEEVWNKCFPHPKI